MPPLSLLTELLAIDQNDPADAADLAMLRELLARRLARAEVEAAQDAPWPPDLRAVE
jgi:hypothetical protein